MKGRHAQVRDALRAVCLAPGHGHACLLPHRTRHATQLNGTALHAGVARGTAKVLQARPPHPKMWVITVTLPSRRNCTTAATALHVACMPQLLEVQCHDAVDR